MKYLWIIPTILITGFAWAELPDWASEPSRHWPEAEAMAQLRAGEVLVKNSRMDESGGAALVQAVFHSDTHGIWKIIGNCEQNYRFVDGLLDCEVFESTEFTAKTRQSVKKSWYVPRLDYEFETARHPWDWIRIRLLGGDLKEMEGSWRFDPIPDTEMTLVTHEIRLKPKLPAPRWLVRRTLRGDLPDMVACLRWMSDSSGGQDQGEKDRDRCPSD